MKRRFKVVIDILMTCMLYFQMAFIYTDQKWHEWNGVALIVLFAVHHLLNFNWIKRLNKGRYSALRIVFVVTNVSMLIAMLGLMISGIRMSQYTALGLKYGLSMSDARKIHVVSAYMGYFVISIHVGLHWASHMKIMFSGIAFQMRKREMDKVMNLLVFFLAIYGVYAVYKHQILQNALLINTFVFFDFEQIVVSFLLDYIAIMGLCILIGHQIAKYLKGERG